MIAVVFGRRLRALKQWKSSKIESVPSIVLLQERSPSGQLEIRAARRREQPPFYYMCDMINVCEYKYSTQNKMNIQCK